MAGEKVILNAANRALDALGAAQENAPELSPRARDLLTLHGVCNEAAHIAELASGPCDRDEIAALNVRVKIVRMMADIQARILEHGIEAHRNEAVARVEAELAKGASGGATSFDGFDPPTAPGTGAN